eukprot:4204199-Karenia_brevis.AAC.1
MIPAAVATRATMHSASADSGKTTSSRYPASLSGTSPVPAAHGTLSSRPSAINWLSIALSTRENARRKTTSPSALPALSLIHISEPTRH